MFLLIVCLFACLVVCLIACLIVCLVVCLNACLIVFKQQMGGGCLLGVWFGSVGRGEEWDCLFDWLGLVWFGLVCLFGLFVWLKSKR